MKFSPESPGFTRKLGVIVFALKNRMATQVGKELASWGGIGVRSGCHYAHITVKHILQVGSGLEKFQKLIVTLFPKLSLPGVVRVSFCIGNTKEDIATLIQVLAGIAEKTQSASKKEIKQPMEDFVRAAANRVYS
jgi:selenocysteine lyase/cysteine desulfurase